MKLISITPNYMDILKTAAGQCYQQTLTNAAIERIIQNGHLSVLEHCAATLQFQCSVSVLLQITRHRHLSFTVQSTRGSVLTEYYKTGNRTLDAHNEDAMNFYMNTVRSIRKEDAAYLIPKAALYSLVVTGNFRAWLEYLPKRLCKRAMPEHRQIASGIHELLAQAAPEIFGRDMMECARCIEKECVFYKG